MALLQAVPGTDGHDDSATVLVKPAHGWPTEQLKQELPANVRLPREVHLQQIKDHPHPQ